MAGAIDQQNAEFWNYLCGTNLARQLGITGRSMEDIRTFDRGYLAIYPFLRTYLPGDILTGKRVMEIGLGFGTVGELIAASGADYTGVDIAAGPAAFMKARLQMSGLPGTAVVGNALSLPFADDTFDTAVAIGSLHHTGDLPRAIDEVRRVLKPGGTAVVMVYNKFSYWQWLRWPLQTLAGAVRELRGSDRPHASVESQRRSYDANASGEAAPETVFTSVAGARELFRGFARVTVRKENVDYLFAGKQQILPRWLLLPTLGRWWGRDLYVTAVK